MKILIKNIFDGSFVYKWDKIVNVFFGYNKGI